jgi:hypothetical protein
LFDILAKDEKPEKYTCDLYTEANAKTEQGRNGKKWSESLHHAEKEGNRVA